jgi:hypothetical protein
MINTIVISDRRLAGPIAVAVVATVLVIVTSSWLAAGIFAAVGLLVAAGISTAGAVPREQLLYGLGGYNAVAALGCLAGGMAGLSATHHSVWQFAALGVALVIVGALVTGLLHNKF